MTTVLIANLNVFGFGGLSKIEVTQVLGKHRLGVGLQIFQDFNLYLG